MNMPLKNDEAAIRGASLARPDTESAVSRVKLLDWSRVGEELNESGNSVLTGILSRRECEALASLYASDDAFRSRIVMARHGFGRGEYKYFSYPLPDIIQELRTALYDNLASIANGWNQTLGIGVRYPRQHADFIQRCHDAGQLRPTPLLLQYGAGDYNCLHQDLYGEHIFPFR